MSDDLKQQPAEEVTKPVEEVTDQQDEKEIAPENLDQVTGGARSFQR